MPLLILERQEQEMQRDQREQVMARAREEILRAMEDQRNSLLFGPLKCNI
jgi:hypothetical protein